MFEVGVHLGEATFCGFGIAACEAFHGCVVMCEEVNWGGCRSGGVGWDCAVGMLTMTMAHEVVVHVFEVRVEVDEVSNQAVVGVWWRGRKGIGGCCWFLKGVCQ